MIDVILAAARDARETKALEEYATFYYLAALAQGVGNGIVAGIIETGRAASGLRHAFAMGLTAWLVFTLLA